MFRENAPLRHLNTLRLPGKAHYLAMAASREELRYYLTSVTARNLPVLVLGGGSNIILRGDFAGLVIRPDLRGIRVVEEQGDAVVVEAAAGENWHGFVQSCLARGWYGLENLSLIPGTVGAAPVQNIGAYGVEIKDIMVSLTAMARQTGELREFSLEECRFGYRDSVFKQGERDRWVIVAVRFRLSRKAAPRLGYGDIRRTLEASGVTNPGPRDVARAVMAIRRSKLPDPAVIGNAGSFFKNPVVSRETLAALQVIHPGAPFYEQGERVKLAAGWLIDQCGWKGRSLGRAAVHRDQALVLVNPGDADSDDILGLAQAIRADVLARFGVMLEIEPDLV